MATTQERLRNFERVYKNINENVDKYHRYQPWLIFSLINDYSDGSSVKSLTIDTFTSRATVSIPGGKTYNISPIMLTKFEYNKNGSGQANTFSLSFAYNPYEKNDSGGILPDPMIIDKALTISSFYKGNGNGFRAIDTIGKHKCFMTYGYCFNGKMIQSPEYFGQALKATSELRDGLIHYTITGYSSLTYVANIEVDVAPVGVVKVNDSGEQYTEGTERASVIMSNALYTAFKTEGQLDVSLSGVSISEDNKAGTFISSAVGQSLSQIYKGIKVSIENTVSESDEYEITLDAGNKLGLFDYLSKAASSASLKCNDKRKESDKKAILAYRIEESDQELRFVIYIEDPTSDEETSNETLNTNIVYQYPSKENNIVKSFTPDFKFEKIWSKDIFVDSDKHSSKSYFLDENGNTQEYFNAKNTSFMIGGSNSENRSYSTFSQAIQYAYNANLVTLGIPADIPIGTKIYIKPIINGIEYHYGGKYMVIKTTDIIDTSGYSTEYELFKIVPSSAEKKAQDIDSSTKQNTTNQNSTEVYGPQQVDPSKIPTWDEITTPESSGDGSGGGFSSGGGSGGGSGSAGGR